MTSKKVVLLVGVLALAAGALVAQTVYSYKCPSCGGIYSYSRPGIYKCPSDGWTLVRTY